jgi:hypothetical protein
MSPRKKLLQEKPPEQEDSDLKPDWKTPCFICSQIPTVPLTGMCGPCTFGTADALLGGWYKEK